MLAAKGIVVGGVAGGRQRQPGGGARGSRSAPRNLPTTAERW